jgi:toxin ParE1/3/4
VTPRIHLWPQVPDDVLAITQYLLADSPAAAERFVELLPPTLAELASMPGKGSKKGFRNPLLADLRTWRVPGFPNYLICYFIVPDGIDVLAIVHGARDLKRFLRQRKNESAKPD